MIQIDGSYGEGGGQLLRTCLALSALTGSPVHITNIRAGRGNAGLMPQHLASVRAAAQICGAALEGAALGSQDLVFAPQSQPLPGQYVFDVTESARGGSAGAATLLLQTVLLPLALTSGASRVTVRGGTHVPFAPPYEYLDEVYLPALAEIGLAARCSLDAYGFFPVGGGQITAHIYGLETLPGESSLSAQHLTVRGLLRRITGTAVAGNLPSHIPQRMANRAANALASEGEGRDWDVPRPGVIPQRVGGAGQGAAIFLRADYEGATAGFSALGRKGLPSEAVADEACDLLLAHYDSGAPVDMHLADQILLPLALAPGRSVYHTNRVSAHLLTQAWVIQQYLNIPIEIDGLEGQEGRVSAGKERAVPETDTTEATTGEDNDAV